MLPVAVGVLEDEDAVAAGRIPLRIRVRLGDPDAAAVVEREADGLPDVGLAGEEGEGEALRDLELARRFLGRHRLLQGSEEKEVEHGHYSNAGPAGFTVISGGVK